jgi:predicted ATPase
VDLTLNRNIIVTGPWDEEHVKALLHFPRFPIRLIQQDPWQSWIGERGGLKAIQDFLQDYPFSPSHRRVLDVVLSNPECVSEVYAYRLNISRATYFYQLREFVTAILQALNQWELQTPDKLVTSSPIYNNLPAPLTNLVGVDTTLHTLTRLLLYEDVRLLTLLGPGGIGKTRLSIELARNLGCEACFVDLSSSRNPAQVVGRITNYLGIKNRSISTITTSLRDRNFVLILDNFEQVQSARSIVTELLTALPLLKIIVTSRITLNLYGEHQFIVPPLAIISIETVKDQQIWALSPAVSLFVQRAQTVCPSFSLNNENAENITVLCQWLEGLPLAIELAAYQIKYFSPKAMLTQLKSNRLTFFDNNRKCMPPQQQTIRAVFDWSYHLLPLDVQGLFNQLSVFKDDFSIKDVQSVIQTTDLQSKLTLLVDHSLLDQHRDTDGEPRFQMHGITREYANERLIN